MRPIQPRELKKKNGTLLPMRVWHWSRVRKIGPGNADGLFVMALSGLL
jgi:hypothetical protein